MMMIMMADLEALVVVVGLFVVVVEHDIKIIIMRRKVNVKNSSLEELRLACLGSSCFSLFWPLRLSAGQHCDDMNNGYVRSWFSPRTRTGEYLFTLTVSSTTVFYSLCGIVRSSSDFSSLVELCLACL
jgi:hypothetical protein